MSNLRHIVIVSTLMLAMSAVADRVTTTRKHLKPEQPAVTHTPDTHTIISPKGKIKLCGYEKSLRATRETLFIENLTDSTITNVSLTINYFDSSNRQIHQRQINRSTDIPPHQTRRCDIPSWDTQKSYYYIYGETPRKSATPYDITITADSIQIAPCAR